MSSIKEKFSHKFLVPAGALSQRIDSVFIFLAAFGNIVAFYVIKYEACLNVNCDELEIMGFWYNFSALYILLAASDVGIGVYLFKTRDIKKIYSYSLMICIGTTHCMLWLIPFGIANEASKII